MAFWPFWQPSSNKLAILIISSIVLSMLFVKINSSSSFSSSTAGYGHCDVNFVNVYISCTCLHTHISNIIHL